MLYISELYGKNGQTYHVEIVTNNDRSETTTLTMMRGGLLVRVDAQENLFKPLRGGSATITVITDEIYSDLYASGTTDVPVTIWEDEEILFAGYVSPAIYSQELPSHKIQLTIECIDCLSALQDAKFNAPSDTAALSFASLIAMAVDKVKGDRPMQVELSSPFTKSLSELEVDSSNWYDESGEPSAWAIVLENVLQWANCRLYQWRDKFVVTNIGKLITEQYQEIDDIYCNLGATMSLTEVYQSCKVACSLYQANDLLPDVWDGKAEVMATEDYSNAIYGDISKYWSLTKFYKHPAMTASTTYSTDAMLNGVGAWQVATAVRKAGGTEASEIGKYIVLTKCQQATNFRPAGSDNEELVATISDGVARTFMANQSLVISGSAIFNSFWLPYLSPVANGRYKIYDRSEKVGYTNVDCEATAAELQLPISVRIGNKYYGMTDDGNGGLRNMWTDDPNTRYYIMLKEVEEDEETEENFYMREFSFVDTTIGMYELSASGAWIPIDEHMTGALEIGLYLPESPGHYEKNKPCALESVWIKDFRVVVEGNGNTETALDVEVNGEEDVEYYNEIDATFAREGQELQLNVCTQVGNTYSRSAVRVNTNNSVTYAGDMISVITGEKGLAEHHLLNEMVRQYSEPRTILNATWRNHVGSPLQAYNSLSQRKIFLVEAIELDCDNSNSTMTLEQVL